MGKLRFLAPTLQRLYRVNSDAIPDGRTAQLTRHLSAVWSSTPLYLGEGDTSKDGQVQLERLTPSSVRLRHLPTDQVHDLERRETAEFVTRFARLKLDLPDRASFIVEEGEAFSLDAAGDSRFRLQAISDESITLAPVSQPESRLTVPLTSDRAN